MENALTDLDEDRAGDMSSNESECTDISDHGYVCLSFSCFILFSLHVFMATVTLLSTT